MGTTATTTPVGRTAADPTSRLASRVAARLRRPPARDCAVALLFLAAAAWIGHGLWPDPALRALALNPEDQILIEWFLAADTRVLLGEHGLISDRLNAPDGVNMLTNATSLTLGFLLAPVTLAFGAPTSFAVVTVGNLAGTATAWYLLFARTLGVHRGAAVIGGAFCGFSPAMLSHSNSHWHMTAQWLVPAVVWSVVRLARAAAAADHRRVLTSGLWLAGLVVAQFFLGAEVLYLTALTLLLLAVAYAVLRPDWSRRVLPGFLAGLGVAVGAATALLAYPLWVQFAGPGSVPDGPFSPYHFSADLASWPAFSPLALAGTQQSADLATGPAEYNAFLGWPLLLVAAGCALWLMRDRALVLAASAAAVVMGVLALGPELVVNRTRTGLPLPYLALVEHPVIAGALPQRYAVAVVPLVATVLVLALDRARKSAGRLGRWHRPRLAVPTAVAVALVPLVPAPLPVGERPPVPAFVSEGHWRECVEPGGVLVPVPLPTPRDPEAMRWAAHADARFALPQGFFIGPYAAGGSASMGTFAQPTSQLLTGVAETGRVPEIGPEHRAQAARDLAFWDADCVVLRPDQRHQPALRSALLRLLGPDQRIADVRVWRVA